MISIEQWTRVIRTICALPFLMALPSLGAAQQSGPARSGALNVVGNQRWTDAEVSLKTGQMVTISASALTFSILNGSTLFEADYDSGNIYEFAPSGPPRVFASVPQNPIGLAIDSSGDLFVGTIQGSIFKVTPGGTVSPFGSGTSIRGLAFDRNGNLFAADFANGDIYKFTPSGSRSVFASGLRVPMWLAFDGTGNLFAGTRYSGEIYKITPGGTQSIFASGLGPLGGLAFDNLGNLFVGDAKCEGCGRGQGLIYKFTPAANKTVFASGLSSPGGLAFGWNGNLFVADNDDKQLYEITPSGNRSVFSSTARNPNGVAYVVSPQIVPGALTQAPVARNGAEWTADFTRDQSLDSALWSTNTPLLTTLTRKVSDIQARWVYPQISFSSVGLTMAGVNETYQFTAIQSIKSFSPPFTIRTIVRGSIANGNPFELDLASADLRQRVTVAGNINKRNRGYYGMWLSVDGPGVDPLRHVSLFAAPDINLWYTITVAVDARGAGTVTLTDFAGTVLGSQAGLHVGTDPFFIVLAQFEGAPYTVGANVATWAQVQVSPTAGPSRSTEIPNR